MITDDELSKLAEQALLQEAKRGAVRAEISGPSGWLRKNLPSTNKKFLHNTILGTLAANRVKERREKNQSELGKRKRALEGKEKNTYKRLYIGASTKSKTPATIDEYSEKPSVKSDSSKNSVMWSENGLEFSNSSLVKSKKDKKSTETKTSDYKGKFDVISHRNIKFVSSSSSKLHSTDSLNDND